MAIAPLERFAGPSIYRPVADVRREAPTAAPRAVDATTTEPRPVGPVEARAAEPAAVESLTSSARAATVALAAVPREAVANIAGAQEAAADAEDAALAALADPLRAPTPQEVARSFAAVAALVPSPQQLVNDAAAAGSDDDRSVAAPGSVRRDRELALGGDGVGARLSRFA